MLRNIFRPESGRKTAITRIGTVLSAVTLCCVTLLTLSASGEKRVKYTTFKTSRTCHTNNIIYAIYLPN